MTYLLAFIFHLTFEAPFLVMRRLFCFESMIVCHEKYDIDNDIHGHAPANFHTGQHLSSKHFEENLLLPSAKIINSDSVELKSVSKL